MLFLSRTFMCISHIDKGKSHMREFLFATGSFFLSFVHKRSLDKRYKLTDSKKKSYNKYMWISTEVKKRQWQGAREKGGGDYSTEEKGCMAKKGGGRRGGRSSNGKLIDRYGFFLSSCAQCSREEWAIRRDLYRLNDDVLTRVDLWDADDSP